VAFQGLGHLTSNIFPVLVANPRTLPFLALNVPQEVQALNLCKTRRNVQ
jgi:hypothetical protein